MSDPFDEVEDVEVFDLTQADIQEWESKDKTSATIRMKDPTGLCDMKIYLLLSAKVHQMAIDLGFHGEVDITH